MSSTRSKGRLVLLHIDDSPEDRLLVKVAIKTTQTPFVAYGAADPAAAALFFQAHHPTENDQQPRPAIVLLDYDLGLHTGAEFLYWLRVQKQITSIPVVLYSACLDEDHLQKCYALGADHCLCKAHTLARLSAIVRTLQLCMSFA